HTEAGYVNTVQPLGWFADQTNPKAQICARTNSQHGYPLGIQNRNSNVDQYQYTPNCHVHRDSTFLYNSCWKQFHQQTTCHGRSSALLKEHIVNLTQLFLDELEREASRTRRALEFV